MSNNPFLNRGKPQRSTSQEQRNSDLAGDLDGDGDVDVVDKIIAIVQFIQTPKGQMLVLVAAATFSLVINISTYTKSMIAALNYLGVPWLTPLSWLAAIIFWALIQVLETLPRTSWWDIETKFTVLGKLQGMDLPFISDLKNKQTDLVYWQETVATDYEIKRKTMIIISIAAHISDAWALWIDFPLYQGGILTLHPNLWVMLFMMFSFEGLIAISQFVKQFTAKPKKA